MTPEEIAREFPGVTWTVIPRIVYADDAQPGWLPRSRDGKPAKPVIRCMCGTHCGIGLHHVHESGHVTRSFYHSNKPEIPYSSKEGCEWHVWLLLKDYDYGDQPPEST